MYKITNLLKTLSLILLLNTSSAFAEYDIIYRNGMEFWKMFLNDTGVTWGGDFSSGNNDTCISNVISPQDCLQGNDFLFNDDNDGHAGFQFTKLSASGDDFIFQSVDYETTPWFCVRDNVTGLVWEVKTNDGGLHDKNNKYRWGGTTAKGLNHPNAEGTYYNDWDTLVADSNTNRLCGRNNWRVPTLAELSSIVNKGTFDSAIDINFFPNTVSNWYWTSSPVVNNQNQAWNIFFYNGNDNAGSRTSTNCVRLVHTEL